MNRAENLQEIRRNYEKLRQSIPEYVTIVAATKTRTVEEIEEAIQAGVEVVGENYVQEAARKYEQLKNQVEWHMIGHLQRNKVKKALEIFDCIQTVDSPKLAEEINRRCQSRGKVIPILIEVNIAGESTKSGILPEAVTELVKTIAGCPSIKLKGLMTIEPYFEEPENARPYFKRLRELFDQLKKQTVPGVEMEILSMGMSNSYRIAIEEGSTMVRIGTAIFGPREY